MRRAAARGGGGGQASRDAAGNERRPNDWTCPACGINVFASKIACFKCGVDKDGKKVEGKGHGKGGPALAPPPNKFSEELWEAPRAQTGLQLMGELVQNMKWSYVLQDESRRSFAGYHPCPFAPEQCKSFFDEVHSGTEWRQPEGPQGPIPRKTAWMVAAGCKCVYRYGSIEVEPQEYPPWMTQLMRAVMPCCGLLGDASTWPGSCNVNLYEDGGMSVGWHSDDERIFQGKFQDIRIISLSLGAARKFELRANWPAEGENPVRQMRLGDGDLCTMEGMVQKHFQHRVPREGHVQGARINLTWRWIAKHLPQCPAARRR